MIPVLAPLGAGSGVPRLSSSREPGRCSTAYHHEQVRADTARGLRVGMCRLAPARVTLVRDQVGAVSRPYGVPPSLTGRSFAQGRRIGRFFSGGRLHREIDARLKAGLADMAATMSAAESVDHSSASGAFQCSPKRKPSHPQHTFPKPLVVGPNQPREAGHEVPQFRAFGAYDDR